jgi:carbon monoxide dehydrogenase subunit G
MKLVSVELSAELKRFLKTSGNSDKIAESALDDLGIKGETHGKLNIPVVTNRLRSSWHFENHRSKTYVYTDNSGRTFDGRFSGSIQKDEVIVGTNVEYAESVNARRGFREATYEYLVGVVDEVFMKYIERFSK